MKRLKVLFLLVALPLLFACKSAPDAADESVQKEEAQTVEETVVEPTENVDEQTEPVANSTEKGSESESVRKSTGNGNGYVIYFAPRAYKIDSFTANRLNVIAKELQEENADHIVIVGHSAKLNTVKDENRISLQRAEAVAEYFQSLDIFDADSIEIKGNGAENPVGSHAEIAERCNNRRVEINY